MYKIYTISMLCHSLSTPMYTSFHFVHDDIHHVKCKVFQISIPEVEIRGLVKVHSTRFVSIETVNIEVITALTQ